MCTVIMRKKKEEKNSYDAVPVWVQDLVPKSGLFIATELFFFQEEMDSCSLLIGWYIFQKLGLDINYAVHFVYCVRLKVIDQH